MCDILKTSNLALNVEKFIWLHAKFNNDVIFLLENAYDNKYQIISPVLFTIKEDLGGIKKKNQIIKLN